MSWLFLKRFLARPMQVASVIPSSPMLVGRVAETVDFSKAAVIAEFGPGEGVHTRRILREAPKDARILLFELDAEFCEHLRKEFGGDPRVEIHHESAVHLPEKLEAHGLRHCDYVISGIPFSIMDAALKQKILHAVFQSLSDEDHAAFVIYQVTRELVGHARQFPSVRSRLCLWNLPPMYVTVFSKQPAPAFEAEPPLDLFPVPLWPRAFPGWAKRWISERYRSYRSDAPCSRQQIDSRRTPDRVPQRP
jgi:phospholipid N-methyltransferase